MGNTYPFFWWWEQLCLSYVKPFCYDKFLLCRGWHWIQCRKWSILMGITSLFALKKFAFHFWLLLCLTLKMKIKWLEKFWRTSAHPYLCSKCSLTYAKSPQQSGNPPFSPLFSPQGQMWGLFFTFISNFHWNLDYKWKTPTLGQCISFYMKTQTKTTLHTFPKYI